MKNTKKKGFTIVELVIVVAVVAVLAAVLIPTFSGIVQKARQNADEQTVANMNKYVAVAAAEEEFVFAADAVNALYAKGFNIGKFKTFTKGYHYAYGGPDNNQFYLLDKDGDVVFPKKAAVDKSSLWGFFNNEKSDKIEGVTKYIALSAITDANLFNKDDCVFGGTESYRIDLNQKVLTVADTGKNIFLENGYVLESVKEDYERDDKSVVASTVSTAESIKKLNVTNGVTTIENTIFIGNSTLYLNDFADGATQVVFKNCAFDFSNSNAYIYLNDKEHNTTITSYELINCTFGLGAANVVIVGNNSEPNVTVKDCTFSSGRGLCIGGNVESDDPYFGDILIENNTFIDNGTAEGKPSLQFSAGNEEFPEAFSADSLTIKDNEFICSDIAIRIHASMNAFNCDNVVVGGNEFAEGVTIIDGDGKSYTEGIVGAFPKFE